MASPVFHGLVGAGLAAAMAGGAGHPLASFLRRTRKTLAAAAVLACLPDIDYLPGLWRGSLNTTHQQATHSVAWVLLVAVGIWLVGRAFRPVQFGRRALLFLLIVIGSHLAIDLVTLDRSAPYGIPLWAPVSTTPVRAPVALLPAWDKATLGELAGSGRNLRVLGIELGAGVVFLAAGAGGMNILSKRGRPGRPSLPGGQHSA
jgi:membrane-bound metal-dependent hydrolase YbcI (DUF457 family)